MVQRRSYLLLFFLLSAWGWTLGQDNIGCYVPGECLFSFYLNELPVDDPVECLQECKGFDGCTTFTHYLESGACYLYEECADFSVDSCDDCISGDSECTEELCAIEGIRCQGTVVDIDTDNTTSANDCLLLCQSTGGCEWFIYDNADGACILTEDCPSYIECDECTLGSVTCNSDGGNPEGTITVMVIGGISDNSIDDDVELIQISPNGGGGDCFKPADMPSEDSGVVAMVNSDGQPMYCGGSGFTDQCFVYVSSSDTWIPGPQTVGTLKYQTSLAVLSDGRYWIAGGSSSSTGLSEFYDTTTGEFSAGPVLPFTSLGGCAIEIEPDTVFIGDESTAFLFNPSTETFTRIDDPPTSRSYYICGVVDSPLGGKDLVVAGSTSSVVNIYNLDLAEWRIPAAPFPVPSISAGAAVPFGDTFVILGGQGDVESYSRQVYEYDIANEDWILRPETLSLGRDIIGAVVVTDELLTDCS